MPTRFLAAIAALVGLVAAILFLAPFLVRADGFKNELEARATAALGREVRLGDELSFSILPAPSFRAADVAIANPPGFSSETFVEAARVDIGVGLFGLFVGDVNVKRFVLIRPQFAFERLTNGEANWVFEPTSENGSPDEGAAGETPSEEAPAGGGASSLPRELRLGDVRIEDGRVDFIDRASDAAYVAEAINAKIRLDDAASPLEASGDFTLQGAPGTADVVLASLADLRAGAPASLKVALALADATMGADLSLTPGDDGTIAFAGPLSVDAPDLRGVLGLFGVELASGPGYKSFSADAAASGDADGVRLADATIAFDEIDATGELALDVSGARPKASGSLRTSSLDLRPYAPPAPEAASGGFPAWSTAPIDLSSLRNMDAAFDVSADEILLNDFRTGASRLRATVDNGRMTAELPVLKFYGGEGGGRLVVDARQATPRFDGSFKFGAVDAARLAADVLKNDRLEGLGAVDFSFAARGASQADIMKSLSGAGGFDFADGALRGVDIVGLVEAASSLASGDNVSPARFVGAVTQATTPGEATQYARFLSQFGITDGVVASKAIALTGPYLEMAGDGSVSLAAQTIDLRLAPRVTKAADRSGDGVVVPLRVTGSFAAPKVAVDAEALARGRIEDLGRRAIDRALGEDNPLSGLLQRSSASGGGQAGAADGEAGAEKEGSEEPGAAAKRVLNDLFGGRRGDADDETKDEPERR